MNHATESFPPRIGVFDWEMEHTKYERLSIEDDLSTSGKHPLDSSCSGEQRPTVRSIVSCRFSTTILLSYCVLSTTIIAILAAAILGKLGMAMSCQQGSRDANSFHSVLGSDPAYMSLDHKYDTLWDDLGSTGFVIKLPDAAYGGQPRHASVSMYVLLLFTRLPLVDISLHRLRRA